MQKEDYFPQFEKLLLPWLGRAMKSFDFHLADELLNAGISLSKHQIILLRILSMEDGIPQNDLAFITDRDKTSLTRLISTMERKGLLKRKTCETDKRVNNVFITQIIKGHYYSSSRFSSSDISSSTPFQSVTSA